MPPPCFAAASPCIFSETLTLTSKNLLTQRSRQTDSPLLRSASRYDVSMHFAEQDLRRLDQRTLVDGLQGESPERAQGRGGSDCVVRSTARNGNVCNWKEYCVHWGMENVPAVHVRDHVDLGLCGCDLLLGRELGAAAEEERHVCMCGIGA